MLSVANRAVNAIGGGGAAGRIQGLTPVDKLTSLSGLQEAGQIGKAARLPGLKQCTESWALQTKKEVEQMKANLFFMKQGASNKKKQMDALVEGVKTRLEVRQHGMQSAVQIAGMAAQHRVAGLQMGYMLNEQKEVVNAWEQVANRSASMINF